MNMNAVVSDVVSVIQDAPSTTVRQESDLMIQWKSEGFSVDVRPAELPDVGSALVSKGNSLQIVEQESGFKHTDDKSEKFLVDASPAELPKEGSQLASNSSRDRYFNGGGLLFLL